MNLGCQTDLQRSQLASVTNQFSQLPGGEVDDALLTDPEVNGSDPDGLVHLIGPILDGSDKGELRLIDGIATVSGVAFDPVEAEEIDAVIERAEQSGLTVDNRMTILELSEDRQIVALQIEIDQIFELARALAGQNPSFAISDGKLSPQAAEILDRVIVAMRRYPLRADLSGIGPGNRGCHSTVCFVAASPCSTRAAITCAYSLSRRPSIQSKSSAKLGQGSPLTTRTLRREWPASAAGIWLSLDRHCRQGERAVRRPSHTTVCAHRSTAP